MSAAKEVDVEQQLRLAAATAAWPATPDLRAGVLARIEATRPGTAGDRVPSPVPPAPRSRLRPIAALALAMLALLVVAGVAAGLGFRLPGLEIVFVDRLPSVAVPGSIPPPAGEGLNLGSPVPLAEAMSVEAPRVLVPAALPAPDTAYVVGSGDQRIVTLAWRAEPGQERMPFSDLALTVMAVPGGTNDSLIKKLVAPDTSIEAVIVGGDRGWWISGARHEFFVEQPDGDVGMLRASIAGDTLVFARDGTLYRLESSLGRDATIAIAESLQ
jgi:hypothetical protein